MFKQAIIPAIMVAGMVVPALADDAAKPKSVLELTVTNISDKGGNLMVALSNSQASYDSHKPLQAKRVAVTGKEMTLTFEGLAPGEYAIRMYQDENTNNELDRNVMDIPAEPWGFSGNPKHLFGPANWEQARFSFSAQADKQTINLR